MEQLFEIDLRLPPEGSREAARILCRQMRTAIQQGRLAPGSRLPAARSARRHFGVSRNTVAAVYARLRNEGYVASRRGSGTYVANALPKSARAVRSTRALRPDRRLNALWLRPDVTAAMGFWREPSSRQDVRARVDFRPALVDWRLFPFDILRRISVRELRGLEKKTRSSKSPQGNQGNFFLRDGISRHIALTRSVSCRADEVIVTSGAQQAFDLLARTLVTPGKTVVAIEDPGYPPMRVPFIAAGAKLTPVPTDSEGLIVDQIPANAGVICVCPSHQFPLGVTMSPSRRAALVRFARERGAVIIEDDYDGEFRYEGSFVKALRSTAAADIVFYVGTFSKCMLPAFRLGYVVAPEWALRTLITAKNALDWHCPTPIQTTVAGFINGGHLARHVRRMREVYRRRRALLLSALERDLADWLEPISSFYGMHVAARSRAKQSLGPVAMRLIESRVKIHTFDRYYLGTRRESGLIFGYGAADLSELEHGLAVLRTALSNKGNG